MIATTDLRLALRALRHPLSLLALSMSLFGALAIIVALMLAVRFFVLTLHLLESPWLQGALSYGGMAAVLIMGWFLFPIIVTSIAGLFLEPVANRLEREYYPELPTPKPAPLMEQIRLAAQSLLRAIGLNLIILPLLFIPVVNVLAYLAVNAHLLAREYFFVISLRHLSLLEAQALYSDQRRALRPIGLLLAILFIIPGINLLAPVVATALLLHRLERKSDAPLRARLALAPANVLPD